MDEHISDYRLQIMLRNYVKQRAEKEPYLAALFHSLFYCGMKINPNTKVKDIIVITNGEQSRILGTAHCNSPWYCPHCATVQMSKHAARIATAIDALKKQGQLAFMLTLTIPHNRGISCDEVTDILYKTWHEFIREGNKATKTRSKQFKRDGSKKQYVTKNAFTQFCTQLNCKHRVRVIEYTWGKNGWHPHMHCLFWVPKKNLQTSLEWESELRQQWLKIAEKQTIKVLCKRRNADKQSIIKNTSLYFEKRSELFQQKRVSFHISTDKNGVVIAQNASQYICGWGAERELTGNYQKKATYEGHMTPHQILTAAYEATDTADREKWLDLYLEYMLATRRRHLRRVQFSRTGILKIIAQYRQTEAYIETLKKKCTEKAWRPVVWFDNRQWSEICLCKNNKYLIADIIERAHLPDAREQITKLLLQYDIDIRYNNPADKQEFIDNYINNPDFIAA